MFLYVQDRAGMRDARAALRQFVRAICSANVAEKIEKRFPWKH